MRPALDRAGVSVDLTVLGPGVTDELVARFPRVDFRGFVPDLSAGLAGFDAAVVPLRLGGGTKLKLLDALAAGLPVVTTPVGTEGLRVTDGEHLLVADGAEAFASTGVACWPTPGLLRTWPSAAGSSSPRSTRGARCRTGPSRSSTA